MKINLESANFTQEEIARIEKKYNAQYICDSEVFVHEDVGYAGCPCSFFWTPEKHPRGSNYFCLYFSQGDLFIANGEDILNQRIAGIEVDGEIIFSRYRHDFRSKGDYYIDGGREYNRIGGDNPKRVLLMVNAETNKLEVVDTWKEFVYEQQS